MYSLFGKGTFRITDTNISQDINFTNSKCKISFASIEKKSENINDEIVVNRRGWRVSLDVEIKMVTDNIEKLVALTIAINTGVYRIYPSYDTTTNTGNWYYDDFVLTSDFSPEQLHKCLEVGQSLKLKFIKKGMISMIPPGYNFTIIPPSSIPYTGTGGLISI